MIADETIDLVIQEIQQEILEEEGLDFSTEEVFNIANSQFVCGAVAVNKRISYVLPFIGTFLLKNKRYMIQSVIHTGRLKEQLPEEQYNKLVEAKRRANKKVMKVSNIPYIKNLSALPRDLADSRSISSINALYKQIIAEHIENPDIEIDLKTHKVDNRKIETEYISVSDELKDELLKEERNIKSRSI